MVGLLFLLLLTLRKILAARNVCVCVRVRVCSTKFCEPNHVCVLLFLQVLVLPRSLPARFKVVVKNLSGLCLKRPAGGNSKGLRCQYHRYCVDLKQTVLQLQRASRSTVLLALELSQEEEEKGGNLSFFLSSFLSFFLAHNALLSLTPDNFSRDSLPVWPHQLSHSHTFPSGFPWSLLCSACE